MSDLVRWGPFDRLAALPNFQRLFENASWGPSLFEPFGSNLAMDVYETDDDVVVKVALPGVKPEDIEITVLGDTLTIKGEIKSEEDVEERNYIRRERRYGKFSRSVTLPGHLETDKTEAEFEDGILRLTVPKSEEVKRKAIEVKIK